MADGSGKENKMADFVLTPGALMVLGGIGLIVLAAVWGIADALTAGGRKRRMAEKMKERY